MSEENLSLIKKLAKIRNISDVAQKNKQGYGYTYTDITEILANVTAGMKNMVCRFFHLLSLVQAR